MKKSPAAQAVSEPRQKAAECEIVLRRTTESKKRELLVSLRALSIALANETPFLTKDDLANEIDVLVQIQSDITADLKAQALTHH